ncbi:MAG: TonB-dependent receptor plug domain-containing protein, partial [Pseudomonadota bacterium]
MHVWNRSKLAVLLSTTALLTAPALAQDEEAITLDQIIIEGELQERTLQETQTSVAVYLGEELDESTDFDLYDVIDRTPNVQSRFGEQGFAIRGISQSGQGGGSGLLINVLVDGISLPSNQATTFGPYGTWDLQQVEVLRGPQSTQQGRNALAGAIVLETADPTFEREFKARGGFGEYQSYDGAFMLNLPIVDDVSAVRLAFETNHTDGFVENPT